jgi:D-amino-acid dehydrogenase
MHIAVIGAGIIGLTTCRALIARGHRVTLLEKSNGVATGASGNNGAQLSYAYVAPLATPSILRELPALLFSKNAPLSLSLSLHPRFLRWSAQFLAQCTQARLTYTTAALLELAAQSRMETDAWLETLPDRKAVSHRRNGKLVLYATQSATKLAEAQLHLQRQFGIDQTLLSQSQCVAVEPALSAYAGSFVSGIHTETDETADCASVCAALLRQLQDATTFRFMQNTAVRKIRIEHHTVTAVSILQGAHSETLGIDAVVVCAGAATDALLSPLGMRVPILPLKGYSIDLPITALERFPTLSITDSKRKVVFAPLQGEGASRLRVAGFAELDNTGDDIPPHRIDSLLESTDALFGLKPGARAEAVQWAGHRPVTPHSRPYIGRTRKISNLFVNAGQGALGFTLAFGSAAHLARIVSNTPTTISRTLFSQHPLCIG